MGAAGFQVHRDGPVGELRGDEHLRVGSRGQVAGCARFGVVEPDGQGLIEAGIGVTGTRIGDRLVAWLAERRRIDAKRILQVVGGNEHPLGTSVHCPDIGLVEGD